MRRSPLTLLVSALLASGAPAVSALPPLDSEETTALLEQHLTHSPLPLDGDLCPTLLVPPVEHPGETGCGTLDAGGGGSVSDGAPVPPGFELRARDSIQTPKWFFDPVPLAEPRGAYLRVHGHGDVVAVDGSGENLWIRTGRSFFPDWGLQQWLVPFVPIGLSPVDPFPLVSERPYALGDLTGDGRDELAVAHWIALEHGPDGSEAPRTLAAVTVLDAADGSTLWHRLYPGQVGQLLIDDGRLIVGHETGDVLSDPTRGQDGSVSTLRALRFVRAEEGSSIEAEALWSRPAAPWARWLAAEPVGAGRLAVAFTDRPLGAGGPGGRVAMIDSHTGEAVWSVDTAGYPRTLRIDHARDLVVVHEQEDPSGAVYNYALRGLRLDDGGEAAAIQRKASILLALRVGDVDASPGAEWVTSDVQLVPAEGGLLSGLAIAGRVVAADPESGKALWSHLGRDVDLPANRPTAVPPETIPLGLELATANGEPLVVVASQVGIDRTELLALDGALGAPRWRRYGTDVAVPVFLTVHDKAEEPSILMGTRWLVTRAFSLTDGSTAVEHRPLAEIRAAEPHDVDGDGVADLLVGTNTGVVFGLDGTGLSDDPEVLWRRDVGDGIRRIVVRDLDGDGEPEAVVAASGRGLLVLDPSDGSLRYQIAADPYTWDVTIEDLDDDGRPDLLVPGTALRAYRGVDGAPLWSYPPASAEQPWTTGTYFSSAATSPGGPVVAQFLVNLPDAFWPVARGVVAVDPTTGLEVWRQIVWGIEERARLWHSVEAHPGIPGADGMGVAVSYSHEGNRVRTDVLDARTGETVYQAPLAQGQVQTATRFWPGAGLLVANWFTVADVTPDGAREVFFGGTTDAALADFGAQGRAFLNAWIGTDAFPADAPHGGQGSFFPSPSASWFELFGGTVRPVDLDGDGVDEVISTTFDWEGMDRVARWEDSGILHWNAFPQGLAILEAVEA